MHGLAGTRQQRLRNRTVVERHAQTFQVGVEDPSDLSIGPGAATLFAQDLAHQGVVGGAQVVVPVVEHADQAEAVLEGRDEELGHAAMQLEQRAVHVEDHDAFDGRTSWLRGLLTTPITTPGNSVGIRSYPRRRMTSSTKSTSRWMS